MIATLASLCATVLLTAEPASLLGASGPGRARGVVHLDGGFAFVMPHLTVGTRLGVSRGGFLGLSYRTVSGIHHAGELAGGWGSVLGSGWRLGLVARTSIATAAPIDDVMNVPFAALALANDWVVGGALVATTPRPLVLLSLSIGSTASLGGPRYSSYDDRAFTIDPALRSVDFAITGEWVRTAKRNLYARVEGTVLFGTDPVPLGFLPVVSVGGAWLL